MGYEIPLTVVVNLEQYGFSRADFAPLDDETVRREREKRGEDGELVTVNAFAGARDLRRAFGFRWSRLVMPPVLKELMRHESIETTMRYYVGVNTEATADELWRVAGNISGNIAPTGDSAPAAKMTATR